MKHKTILTLLTILLSLTAIAVPARKGIIPLTQPDGTTFNAYFRGDEHVRIKTTADGHAIIQNEDGWWCYARYDADGNRYSSGWHVGEETPQEVVTASRNIPYSKLSQKRRMTMEAPETPIMATKAGETAVKHGIVLLAQFKDKKFQYGKADFEELLTQKGYSLNGAIGSAREYFDAQFEGRVEFKFDVSEIITLPGTRADYGANDDSGQDKGAAMMVIDACRIADSHIDFSIYDDNSDGEIDNVFIFFAGEDEAEGADEECIWSHAWYIYNGAGYNMSLDGKMLNRYACTSELTRMTVGDGVRTTIAGIGTFCHEYSHTFGLPDFYDTDYDESGGQAAGLWHWTSLMDGGNQNSRGQIPPYFNAIEREILGLCKPAVISRDGMYVLEPIDRGGKAYRIDTEHPDEYFLIECRSGKDWDSGIGGSGMLVYHIDKSERNSGYSEYYGSVITAYKRWTNANEVNCRPDRQCADLLEADKRQDGFSADEDDLHRTSMSNINGVFYPYMNVNHITSDDKRGLVSWSGAKSKASITNIKKDGDKIIFNVIGFSDASTPPDVENITHEVFCDAAIIQFESSKTFSGNAVVTWGKTGKDEHSMTVKAYEPGKFAAVIEGLEPGNKTYSVSIAFEIKGVAGKSASLSFMTKKAPAVDWPFIYMNNAWKSPEGKISKGTRLPLRVYNASGAAEIEWSFNGRPISVGGNGYYTVTESGTLKAHITFTDGGETYIIKEIITE